MCDINTLFGKEEPFSVTPDELREQIRDGLPAGIEAMMKVLSDPESTSRAKIDAFKALADRGGIPEVKATISQQVSDPPDLDALEKQKKAVLDDQKNLADQIKKLKAGGVEDARQVRDSILPQLPTDQEGA